MMTPALPFPLPRLRRWLASRTRHARRGATAPLVGLSMVALLGMTAAALDGGMLYVEQRRLQNMADAAALAGVRELPGSSTDALAFAQDYLLDNGGTVDNIEEIAVEGVYHANDAVCVELSREVPLSFAQIFGQTEQTVRARAVAITAQVPPTNIWPWGITKADAAAGGDITLKVGSIGGANGNFHALAFPNGRGASTYESNIRNGYPGAVPEDVPPGSWWIETETGNMAGPTDDGVSYLLGQPVCAMPGPDVRCPRIGMVPILNMDDWEAINGRKPVEVIGFALVELTGIDSGPRGQRDVHARFLDYARAAGRPTKLGEPLEGLLGVRLWE